MTDNIDFYSKIFLFKDMSEYEIVDCLKCIEPIYMNFNRGDLIYSKENSDPCVGFVLDGKCEVYRCSDNKIVSLNILNEHSSFGIAALFSDENEFPTNVRAVNKCCVIFIRKDDIYRLIKRNNSVSVNIMRFLADRICFLNDKIATFSSQNVEQKLANFILSEYQRQKNCIISFNCKKSAEAISSGRASLYRAIESLTSLRLIHFETKTITILDPEGLERIAK